MAGDIILKMKIKSPVFENNSHIPSKYTCDGENTNPPLLFSEIPENAKSLVFIVNDPDAPSKTWVHWIVFNIHPTTLSIEEDSVPNGAQFGQNDFGRTDYGGPCPPSGVHRYFFKLYALDSELDLKSEATKQEVINAMKRHILAQSELIGLYQRKR